MLILAYPGSRMSQNNKFGLKTVDYCENAQLHHVQYANSIKGHYIMQKYRACSWTAISSAYRLDVRGGMASWWRMGQRVLIYLVLLFLLICSENITYHTSVQISNMASRKCGVKPSQRINRWFSIQLESQLEMAVQNLEDLCIFMVITLKIFSTQWQIRSERVL